MKRLFLTLAVLGLAGCNTVQTTPPPTAEATPVAAPQDASPVKNTTTEVTFLDLSGFDEDLTLNLVERNQNVVVMTPAKFSLNNIPDRLEKWLSAVKDSGGKVQAKATEPVGAVKTRGLVSALIDITLSAVKAKRKSDQLALAENYNVLLTYDKQTGKVENVLFYHR